MDKFQVKYFDDGFVKRTVNFKLSKELSDKIDAVYSMCWYNNLQAIKLLGRAEYVEGFAVYTVNGKREAWEHSWIECDNEIIDTLPDIEWEMGIETVVYFPGAKYSKKFALANEGVMPFSRNLYTPKAYNKAFAQAMQYQPTEAKKRRRR